MNVTFSGKRGLKYHKLRSSWTIWMGLIVNDMCPYKRHPLGRHRGKRRRHMKTEAGATIKQATASEHPAPQNLEVPRKDPSLEPLRQALISDFWHSERKYRLW